MTRNCHQDALSEVEFEQLLDTTHDLDAPYDAECRLILFLGGRLGLRAGEITHLREDWINWRKQQIRIPQHERCDLGKDGGPCGYCRKSSRQVVKRNDDIEYEEAIADQWSPKTSHSVRTIPFGFDERIVTALEGFFFHREHYPRSRCSVNRRVDRLAEAAELDKSRLYPHALRATAATFHAYQGLPIAALQSMFGWADMSTPQKYIRLSGGATREALEDVYG